MEDEKRTFSVAGAAEPVFGLAAGKTKLTNLHHLSECAPNHCVIHNPSDHHMRDWPLIWRGDKGLMERQCECGTGHPDPDDLAWHKSQGRAYMAVHGCCGHCVPGLFERLQARVTLWSTDPESGPEPEFETEPDSNLQKYAPAPASGGNEEAP